MNHNNLIKLCEKVASDVANDATEFDDQPFTGKTVGVYFGNHGAAINALATVIRHILIDLKNQNEPKPISDIQAVAFSAFEDFTKEMDEELMAKCNYKDIWISGFKIGTGYKKPYPEAWIFYKESNEYKQTVFALKTRGVIQPYLDNILQSAFNAGYNSML